MKAHNNSVGPTSSDSVITKITKPEPWKDPNPDAVHVYNGSLRHDMKKHRRGSDLYIMANSAREKRERRPSLVYMREYINVEGVKKRLEKLRREQKFLILPESKFAKNWDFTMLLALFFTGLVTPYEVIFLQFIPGDALFWVNRLIDLIFMIDMVVQISLIYVDDDGIIIKSRGRIIKTYIRSGWAFIDIITVLPYDALVFVTNTAHLVKLIRLLRLLKLVRLLKATRIFARWESKISLPFHTLKLLELISVLILANHIQACIWAALALTQHKEEYTWISAWMDTQYKAPPECRTTLEGSNPANPVNGGARYDAGCFTSFELYCASLHWSMMTVTSIGYGDVVPQNAVEYSVCALLMLISGIFWAYVIGQICAMAANRDPCTKQYHQTSDDMNYFMQQAHIDPRLRQQIRVYLNKSRGAMKDNFHRKMMMMLTPTLAGQMCVNGHRWVRNKMVFWLRSASTEFLARLLLGMGDTTYPPREVIRAKERMYVLTKGTVFTDTLVIVSSVKTVWGEDMFLFNRNLRKNVEARTITYVQVCWLERELLMEVLEEEGWVELRTIRRDFRNLALLRGMQFYCAHNMLPTEWAKKQEATSAAHWKSKKLELLDLARGTLKVGDVQPTAVISPPQGMGTGETVAVAQHTLNSIGTALGKLEARMGSLERSVQQSDRSRRRNSTCFGIPISTAQTLHVPPI